MLLNHVNVPSCDHWLVGCCDGSQKFDDESRVESLARREDTTFFSWTGCYYYRGVAAS